MLDPAQLVAAPGARVLVIAPHPDDESIAAGGLLARAKAHGAEVQVLLLTDGDRNPWPQRWVERRLITGAAERGRWGKRRRREVEQAMRELALPTSALICLAWPDLGITERLMKQTAASISELVAAIDAFAPTLLVFPALGDRHPDHGACHVLVRLAMAQAQTSRPACLCYHVHGAAPAGQAMLVRLNPTELERKQRAVLAHASQLVLSRKRLLRKARAVEVYWSATADESDCSEHERKDKSAALILPWCPPRALRPACELLVLAGTSARIQSLPLLIDGAMRVDCGKLAPVFVKLRVRRRNPWIFDHWGWRCLRA